MVYRSINTLSIILVITFSIGTYSYAQDKVTLPYSESLTLYSPAIEDTFAISIAYPESYASGDQSYPVIYVTDPFFVYGSTVEAARALSYDGRMPEAIIVGIGYTGPQKFRRIMQLRTREYTPEDRFVFPGGFVPQWAKEMDLGNAQEFRSFFSETLFPYIDTNYRVSEDRSYVGFSGGGYFGHYILFHEPELFDRYLLSSTTYWFEREREYEGNLFAYEEAYAEKHDTLDVQLFLSVGDSETYYMVGDMVKMVQTLNFRDYKGLQLDWHIFKDQAHYSVFPVAVNKGLRVLFSNEDARATGGLREID